MNGIVKQVLAAAVLLVPLCGVAGEVIDYEASLSAVASTDTYAPYMIGSWNSGRITAGKGIWHGGRLSRDFTSDKRFSWAYGIEYIAGYGSSMSFGHYDASTHTWGENSLRQSSLRLIQLYGELKYRAVFLQAGMKEHQSGIVDSKLSSGDLTRSNNARPIPGVAAGFLHFVDIPFTRGWVQIDGEIMYGKFFDSSVADKCFNRYNGTLSGDMYYHYKYCYLQSNPDMPFSVIAGAQQAGVFGGWTQTFRQGVMQMDDSRGFRVKDLWNMFFPRQNGEGNAIGNSLGSWDFKARYNFRSGYQLAAYFQWPWEDGSGIAKRNGWDGLWGLQLKFPKSGYVDNVVVEYLDFTNQSGPVHYAPGDWPSTDLTSESGGADDYYNNGRYGPYANYGMAIGSPFLLAPVYNGDGNWMFAHCRARGFHIGVEGELASKLRYVFKFSAQKAWGDARTPVAHALEDYSAGLSLSWRPSARRVPGLRLSADIAFDAGKLRGNNFGAMLCVAYDGKFSFGR